MTILFSGGGTLGPVTPLLAIHDVLREEYPDAEFLWVGTKNGPEKDLVERVGVGFIPLSSGKFRRYISPFFFIDIVRIGIGFLQSLYLCNKESPDICISAGGYVSVPLHIAAWLFGIPSWVHQQDVDVGLANTLMVPFARRITTALERHSKSFPKRKTIWLGNPIRQEVLSGNKKQAIKRFGLDASLPVVFATGGGTGSHRVNQLVTQAVQHLDGVCQVIHLSGKDRPQELVQRAEKHFDFYHVYQFFTDEMKDAYAVADIVVSRGGFGTITELAAMGKASILIPKPGHQVDNVTFLAEQHAVIIVDEQTSDGNFLAKTIKELLANTQKRNQLGKQLHKVMPLATKEKIIEVFAKVVRR